MNFIETPPPLQSPPSEGKSVAKIRPTWIWGGIFALLALGISVYALLPAPTAHGALKGRRVEIHRNAVIKIVFDQSMNHASVERAFSISPATKGTFSWDKNELTFQPDAVFEKGITVEVTIGDTARNMIGKELAGGFRQSLFILDFPDVAVVAPADKSEISSSQLLTVLFDHPLRTLTRNVAAPPELLQLTPPVKGRLHYLGTSGIEFTPENGWPAATDFTATIPKGTKMADGSTLIADYTWSFSTAPLTVRQQTSRNVRLTESIRLEFNYPVRAEAVRSALTITNAYKEKVSQDHYTVQNDKDHADVILITPKTKWSLGTTYAFHLPKGFTGNIGPKGLVADWGDGFETDELGFKLVESTPTDEGHLPPRSSVSLRFNNTVNAETAKQGVTIEPKPKNLDIYVSNQDTFVHVYAQWDASTKYAISITNKLKDVNGQSFEVEKRIRFETDAFAPAAILASYADHGVLAAHLPRVYQLQTLNLHQPVSATLCSGTFDNYVNNERFTCAVRATRTYPTDGKSNTYQIIDIDLDELAGKKLANGFYTLDVDLPELPYEHQRNQSRTLLITDVALTLKRDNAEKFLVWATDMKTGEVVPGLTVEAYSYSRGKENAKRVARGTTDANGVAFLSVDKGEAERLLVVRAEGRGKLGVAWSNWDDGINAWNFGLEQRAWQRLKQHIGYLYTDRLIYRPDQLVYFKGVIRQDIDAKLTVPNLREVEVTITDAQEKIVETQKLPLSAFGTFHGRFQLRSEMPIGTYRFSVTPEGEAESRLEGTFDVREYRRPDFKVEVKTPAGIVTNGQKISLTVNASYFHGTPLGNAKVSYEITRNTLFFQPLQGEWYSYNNLDRYYCYWECRTESNFERVISGEGVLDQNGNLAIDIPANLTDYKSSATYFVTVTVTDVNQRSVSANAEFPVHKGEWYLGIRPNYDKGWGSSVVDFDIVSVNPDGSVRGNISTTVKFLRREWANTKKTGPDGVTTWEYEHKDTLLETRSVVTDSAGKGQLSFTPQEDGEYMAVAETKDRRGNLISASVSRYVYRNAGGGGIVTDDHQMKLLQNKAEYLPGEIASLIVQTPYEKTKALVTIERDTIRETRVVELGAKRKVVEVPITDDAAPNIFVSVVVVKGGGVKGIPEFRMGVAKLQIKTSKKELKLSVMPDKAIYRPRDKATFTIETKQFDGTPVSAEVSIAIVDERVVALLGSIDKNILGRFWFPRQIGVSTAHTLTRLVKKVFFATEGGAGDGKGGGEAEVPTVRGNFLDTAFWKADVVTDDNGKATVSMNFPDNLTRWQVLVIGATKDTIVGAAETSVTTRRDLMVEPLVPRILRHGDTAQIGATVHNTTDASFSVEAELKASGISIDGRAKRFLTLPAHSRSPVNWTIHVPKSGTEAKITIEVRGGNLADGFEQTLPLLPFSVAEVVGASGLFEKSITEKLEPPEDILKDRGEVRVSVAPNVGNNLSRGLEYLVNYEYGCSEQTTSAVLASLAYQELVNQKITKPDDTLLAHAKKKIEGGVKRLVGTQRADGGWALWPDGDSSAPHYTAYVFWGLTRLVKSGMTIDPSALDRADAYLRESLSRPLDAQGYEQLAANERAQVLFMLSERDTRGLGGYAASLYEKRSLLSNFGKSFLAMTLNTLDKNLSSSRAATLLGDVRNKIVRIDPSRAYLKEDDGYDVFWSSDTRSTAIYLQTLLRLDPKNHDVEPLVRALMEKRRDGYWESTQNTAIAFLALAEYAKVTSPEARAIDVEIFLNNTSQGYLKYSQGAVSPEQSKIFALSEILKRGPKVQIGLEKATKDRFFYDISMKTYRAIENIAPFENGFSLISDVYALGDKKREFPLTEVKQGETVRVRLKLLVPKKHSYVALESHLPAGLEAIDFKLKTSPQNLAGEQKQCAPNWWGEQSCLSDWEYGWWWENVWKHIEFRDDRVFLFSEDLQPGVYEYEFLAQAITPGEFRFPPARVYEFYNPLANAHTEGKILRVEGK